MAVAGAARPPTARATGASVRPGIYPFNQNWLFGGRYPRGRRGHRRI